MLLSIILITLIACVVWVVRSANHPNAPRISKKQVARFVEAINKRQAVKPTLDPTKVDSHFRLIEQLIPDDRMLSVFSKPKTIKDRWVVEYHDTLDANGMFQTNCQYDLGDCQLVVHVTLLTQSKDREFMRTEWKKQDVIRIAGDGGKDVFVRAGDGWWAGTVFGQQMLVSFHVRKSRPEGDISMDEQRLWSVLQSIAAKIE